MERTHILLASSLLAACTLPLTGTSTDGGGAPPDAPTSPDAAIGDGGARDAGALPDGGGCGPDSAECMNETLLTCAAGVASMTDCASMDAYCDRSGATFACIDRICAPGTRRCSPDGRSTLLCDSRGASESGSTCGFGCDDATGACRVPAVCPFADVTDLNEGSLRYDSCGYGANHDNQQVSCSSSPQQERVFRLMLTTARTIRIQHEDDSTPRFIDTSLYVRTVCDDPTSEIACEDDSPSVRTARLELTLEPGIYYVFADSRSGGSCGSVRTSLQLF